MLAIVVGTVTLYMEKFVVMDAEFARCELICFQNCTINEILIGELNYNILLA